VIFSMSATRRIVAATLDLVHEPDDDCAVLDYERDPLQRGDLACRIAVHGDAPQHPRGDRGRCAQCFDRRESVLDQQLQLARVLAVRKDTDVAPVRDRDAARARPVELRAPPSVDVGSFGASPRYRQSASYPASVGT
jgi:hypothetical protein